MQFEGSQSLFYWIIYSYHYDANTKNSRNGVSILILLDYLFLCDKICHQLVRCCPRLNPYFIGLSILISERVQHQKTRKRSQSLFYWIIYSYTHPLSNSFNALTVSILILLDYLFLLADGKLINLTPHPVSQSLFYWIIYSYKGVRDTKD